jgi:hypothetical protein
MSEVEILQRLRRRAAKTENLQTLRHIADEVSVLAGIAPESLLGDIGDLQDRLCDRVERLGGNAVPRRPRCVVHNSIHGSPQVRMIIEPWTVDEFGNQSRRIFADPNGPPLRL